MQKNNFKNIVRICYLALYAIIFLSILFVCLKPSISLAITKNERQAYTLIYSIAALFALFYILATGLSAKDSLKTSTLRFAGYVFSCTFLAIFFSATIYCFSDAPDAGALLFFMMAFYLSVAISISWMIWIINLMKFSKISLQKSKKAIVFKSLILALILITISVFALYVVLSSIALQKS